MYADLYRTIPALTLLLSLLAAGCGNLDTRQNSEGVLNNSSGSGSSGSSGGPDGGMPPGLSGSDEVWYGWLDHPANFSLDWWWHDGWDDGTCTTMWFWNERCGTIHLDQVRLVMDQPVDEESVNWVYGGRIEFIGGQVVFEPYPSQAKIPRFGFIEFAYCAEPWAEPLSMSVLWSDEDPCGDDDDWGDDDDADDDDDDDDDDDVDDSLYEMLYDDATYPISVVFDELDYTDNGGTCVEVEIYNDGHETLTSLELWVDLGVDTQLRAFDNYIVSEEVPTGNWAYPWALRPQMNWLGATQDHSGVLCFDPVPAPTHVEVIDYEIAP